MNTLTNVQWIQRFEAYLKRRFPDRSTAKHYVSDLRLFIHHHQGPVSQVTVKEIDAFVDQQRALGLASSTVQRRVAALRTFFRFLAEELAAPDRPNPVCLRRHAGRQPRRLPRDLSDAEVDRLLAVVEEPRDRAMVVLMLYAGLRVGEVVTLCPADIIMPQDLQAPIRLRVMGKGRKERVVYLYREGYQPLAAYLQAQPAADPQAPLFRNRWGQPISVAGVQERLQHYAKHSGVAATCHRLRHTYGRWMAESGMPVLTLSRLLGHTSLQVTQRYIDSADPQVRRSYEAAMARWRTPGAEPTPPIETPGSAVAASEEATIVRAIPDRFEGTAWMPDWPTWLRESCLDWVNRQWSTWKPSQRQHHAQNRLRELRLFWEWQLARRPLHSWADLTTAELTAFIEAQLTRGLAAETVNRHLNTVYGVLHHLAQRGQLATIPRRPELALPDPLPRHLKPEEIVALETYVAQREQGAPDEEWLDLALYYLLAHGGLRISEVLDLQVQDLDLAARRVRVRDGKGHQDRVVFLTQTAAEGVRRYLEKVPHTPADLVLSWRGRPLSYEQAWARIRALGQAVGIPGLYPRRLRHTYATQLLNNGMSLDALQRLMGHQHLSTTLIYAHLTDPTVEQQYRAAMERVTQEQVNSV
jgi:site-specific recombinase XerD